MEATTALREETLEKIQELIEINIDSTKGFKEAAETIDNPTIASLFADLARARAGFAAELQGYVRLNREEPEDSGSAAGTAHRLWLKFRSAVNGGDPKVVLIEAEKGEDAIKEKYQEVLEETSGSPVHAVLLRQYSKVRAGHDRVRDLRDAYLD